MVNIGPDENFITINELYIGNKLKNNPPAEYFPDRPNEVKHANCSSDKNRKLLNYKTTINLDKSIEKYKTVKEDKFNEYDIEINSNLLPITWKEKF